jgi:hypothetical protein
METNMKRKHLRIGLAIVLAVGVGWILIDAFQRAASALTVFLIAVENPSPEIVAKAERNFVYASGLTVGFITGIASVVTGYLLFGSRFRGLSLTARRNKPMN